MGLLESSINLSSAAREARDVRPIADVRSQVAFVRALLDELDRATATGAADALSAQVAEEIARLGCRCVELASALSTSVERPASQAAPRRLLAIGGEQAARPSPAPVPGIGGR